MNVLLRLFDLDGGRILIDGQNIAEVDQGRCAPKLGGKSDTALLLCACEHRVWSR